jgi:hypothetical protein
MATDLDTRRSRRSILAAAAGAALATAASAVAKPLPADAADGDVVHVGDFNLVGTVTTGVSCSGTGPALRGTTTHDGSSAIGVLGYAATGPATGVTGQADGKRGVGVHGIATNVDGQFAYGIIGESLGNGGIGVLGQSRGQSSNGTGVSGSSDSPNGTGVVGTASAGTGVQGGAVDGIGVLATTVTGTALAVNGKATFSRSGRASVPAGKSHVDVDIPGGLLASANILATIQGFRSGVYVAGVRPNYPASGKARIYLNKVASASAVTSVGWFVVG